LSRLSSETCALCNLGNDPTDCWKDLTHACCRTDYEASRYARCGGCFGNRMDWQLITTWSHDAREPRTGIIRAAAAENLGHQSIDQFANAVGPPVFVGGPSRLPCWSDWFADG
jgi:hypothetical protein